MQKKDIHHIVDRIKKVEAQEEQPKLIVLLGAGASVSAGIPLAYKVTSDIVEVHFKDKPEIMELTPVQRKDYYTVMGCLNATERHKVLRGYIKDDKVRVNTAHLYLADLLKQGYIDYILTVNFDDLILRAAALLNFMPPVYDLSILKAKDITTSNFQKGAVIYLHGQHHGYWLLNTGSELGRIKRAIRRALDKICESRTWVVVGYSGEDEVIKYIADLRRFDNELFWVGYKDQEPGRNAKKHLLAKENTGTHWVPGYDADSFFYYLHRQLKLGTPDILCTPFSHLSKLINNLRDADLIEGNSITPKDSSKQTIDPSSNNEAARSSETRGPLPDQSVPHLNERISIVKKLIDDAVHVYEQNSSDRRLTNDRILISRIKLEIEELAIKEKYEELGALDEKTQTLTKLGIDTSEIKFNLAILYNQWGIQLREKLQAIESLSKYHRALELLPENASMEKAGVLYNWGNALYGFALYDRDVSRLNQAIEKYNEAIQIRPDYASAYYNLGTALSTFARLTGSITYYKDSLTKYEKADQFNPSNSSILFNWGIALAAIGEKEREPSFLRESIEKYKQAAKLNQFDAPTFNNWGAALAELAELDKENAVLLLRESLEKYEKAVSLDDEYPVTFYNWGNALSSLGNIVDNKDEKIGCFKASFEQYQHATERAPDDAGAFNNWGTALLDMALLTGSIDSFRESFDKYRKAVELNTKDADAYNNWANALLYYARVVDSNDKNTVFLAAKEKAEKAVE